MNALREYQWPGNIRELQNVIERSVILSSGPILNVAVAELRPNATPMPADEASPAKSTRRTPVRSILAEVDKNQIIRALEETGGRIGGADGAAARIGLKRTTFITRMKKLGIDAHSVSELKMDSTDTSDTADTSTAQDFSCDVTSSK
jgi:formate hydrogenlyase transcriptional activator